MHTLMPAQLDAPIYPRPKATGVYIVRLDADVVKIGFATNIHQRLNNIQSSSTRKIELLAWVTGDMEDEKLLHSRFSSDWIYVEGTRELFRLSSSLLSYINELRASLGLEDWNPQTVVPERFRLRVPEACISVEMQARLDALAYDQMVAAHKLLETRVFLSRFRYEQRGFIEEWLKDPKTPEPWEFETLLRLLVNFQPMRVAGRQSPFVPAEYLPHFWWLETESL